MSVTVVCGYTRSKPKNVVVLDDGSAIEIDGVLLILIRPRDASALTFNAGDKYFNDEFCALYNDHVLTAPAAPRWIETHEAIAEAFWCCYRIAARRKCKLIEAEAQVKK